ncbi:pectate lyase-like adhesive domain-containing protein [Carnobacterium divergens]|uniref:pectate lyase-like adhesive domain-containing protein n=1 Tax=Carnobacterium divergens TaxID=2748 RepID=UPI0007F55C98|nr:pectate lyase-like adhesive domain-containing protein [Carnobacterium divergens]SBO16506.1 Conserved repeat domain protein [Carnobacterium divergens]
MKTKHWLGIMTIIGLFVAMSLMIVKGLNSDPTIKATQEDQATSTVLKLQANPIQDLNTSFDVQLELPAELTTKVELEVPPFISFDEAKAIKQNEHVKVTITYQQATSTLIIQPNQSETAVESVNDDASEISNPVLKLPFIAKELGEGTFYAKAESQEVVTQDVFVVDPEEKDDVLIDSTPMTDSIAPTASETAIEDSTLESMQIKALALEPRAGTNVSTWAEFISALGNAAVSSINVTADLTRGTGTAAGTYTRSITINGNGHTIDFGANNGSITLGAGPVGSVLELNDLTVKKAGAAAIVTATAANSSRWEVVVRNVNGAETGNVSSFINVPNGTITVDGGNSTYNLSNANTVFTAMNFNVINGAKLNSSVDGNNYYSSVAGSKVTINGGSVIHFYSEADVAMQMTARTDFEVSDPGTLLNIEGNSNATGDGGALISIVGAGTEINLRNQAEIKVHSKRTVAMLMNSSGGVFNVSGGSKLNLQSDNNANNLGATLRFRISGNMTFNVSENSEINITKTGGAAPAVRMYGTDNKFIVNSGGKVSIRNYGNGTPNNGGVDAGNQGIYYTDNRGDFNLTGKGSEVKVVADNGPAIDMGTRTGSITAGEGTVFVAQGNTRAATSGIFNTGVSTISVDKPLFYDFRNDRTGGGYVFDVRANSTFTSTQSDLSVWNIGDNLDGDPAKNWSLFDYVLSGANFVTINSTNVPTEFNTSVNSYGSKGASSYSRMSGNNAAPIVDELRMPTNADKSIFGHVKVPIGTTDGRDSWTDESYVVVQVTKPNGTVSEFTAPTIGMNNNSPGLSIYGEKPRAGMFKITLPNNQFVETGDQVKVIKAWRGVSDPSSNRNHSSLPEDLIAPDRISKDVTPPTPTKIKDEATINNATKQISGHSAEPNSLVSITVNETEITGSVVVASNGSWTFDLPRYLEKNDIVQIFLQDQVGSAIGVDNPPVTNNTVGNKNPKTTLAYHDAIFEAAPKVTIQDVLPDTNKVVKSVSVNNSTNTTQVGSILTYTLDISNNKAAAIDTKWRDIYAVDTLDVGLDVDLSSVKVNGSNLPADNVQFNETTRELKINVNDLTTQESVRVTFDTKVNAKGINKTILNTATAIGKSPREVEPFKPGANDPTATMQTYQAVSNTIPNPGGSVFGVLEFVSAPSSISFGEDLKVSAKNQIYGIETMKDNLTVQDSRAIKSSWTMTAKMVSILTSTSGHELPNAVRYSSNGESTIINQTATTIMEHTNKNDDPLILNDTWNKESEGLILKIDGGKAKAESYSGTIQWTLQDTPPNK